MRREGRQHGFVRTYNDNYQKSGATDAHHVRKAPQKPTNQSRFTGKCGRPRCTGCHDLPVTKSRNKTKGAKKLRDVDVRVDHLMWRVKGGGHGLPELSGLSSSRLLGYLLDYGDHEIDCEDEEHAEGYGYVMSGEEGWGLDCEAGGDVIREEPRAAAAGDDEIREESIAAAGGFGDLEFGEGGIGGNEDGDEYDFVAVFQWESEEEEDWFLI
ncbi:uncharacterized protein LOC105421237 [Amborella trichopoda]|uniref:uncharacterized protein LOC105421237 n=1 Tax=Amborella trichopoda TaxID=13333 RepID=UPI0005D460F5|nr:uncharacterized protein LOC105421237 [Amborella trichopoda]|eukprot:XP_011626149.1 uncharacterized protein LOC105421237 [Amborella trichopoda]